MCKNLASIILVMISFSVAAESDAINKSSAFLYEKSTHEASAPTPADCCQIICKSKQSNASS